MNPKVRMAVGSVTVFACLFIGSYGISVLDPKSWLGFPVFMSSFILGMLGAVLAVSGFMEVV